MLLDALLRNLGRIGYNKILFGQDTGGAQSYLPALREKRAFRLLLIQCISISCFLSYGTLLRLFALGRSSEDHWIQVQQYFLFHRSYFVRLMFIGLRAHALIARFRIDPDLAQKFSTAQKEVSVEAN